MPDLPRFANERAPDYVLSDLACKLDDDVSRSAHLVTALVTSPEDRAALSILGCGRMLGSAIAYFQLSSPGFSAEEAVDSLWATRLRPTILSAITGADVREMLKRAEGRQ
jgi:hypothetical protein